MNLRAIVPKNEKTVQYRGWYIGMLRKYYQPYRLCLEKKLPMGLQKKVKAPKLPEYAADMTPFRVYICGPTDFTNYRFLERYCDRALSNKEVIIVIHDDGKTGVANLAAVYAESRYYKTEIASPNTQYDAVIAYRDSTYHTKAIKDAKNKGIPVKVIRY